MENKDGLKKTALVIGASGLVGRHLVNRLLDDPDFSKVIIFVRKKIEILHPKLFQNITDFDNLNSVTKFFTGDSLFCCIGTTTRQADSKQQYRKVDYDYPLQVGKICKANNVKHFLLISTIGANIKSRAFYTRLKGEIEQEIIKLDFDQTSIFRPSFLDGEREKIRLRERAGIFFVNIFSPLLIGKFKKCRAISADAVAGAMLEMSKNQKEKIKIFESDQIQKIFNSINEG